MLCETCKNAPICSILELIVEVAQTKGVELNVVNCAHYVAEDGSEKAAEEPNEERDVTEQEIKEWLEG